MRLPIIALVLTCAAPAAGSQQDSRSTPGSDAAAAQRRNAETRFDHYSRRYGVTPQEAERRLHVMNALHAELPALQEKLERHERGNFANLWIEHEPALRVVVAFKRNAEATLRRYTSNPNFVARQVRYSMEELDAARADAERQLQRLGVPLGMSDSDEVGNDVDIVTRLEQPEVDRLLASGRLRLHPAVNVTGPKAIERSALSPEAARLVRIFPQDPNRSLGGTRELRYGTIILRDGCLRFDGAGDNESIIYFSAETGLKVDEVGRLAFTNRATGETRARVGEPLAMSGGAGRKITDPKITAPINAVCGAGSVVYGGWFESRAAFEGRMRR
jgi:hypothetical protein